MKKVFLLTVCSLCTAVAFCADPMFSLEPGIQRQQIAGFQPFTFYLFPDDQSQVESSTATGFSSTAPGKPHLIELSAKNWRPLTRKEKLNLLWRDQLSWGTHVSIALDTTLSFATNDRPYLGRSAPEYFSRYGLNEANEASLCFFNCFLFPTVFRQDPRYIPRDNGSAARRLAYAITRVFVTRSDKGQSQVNASNLVGMLVSTSISTVMYSSCGGDTGVGGNFSTYGLNLPSEAAFGILKEFWPDVARKMQMSIWLRNIVRASIRDHVRVS